MESSASTRASLPRELQVLDTLHIAACVFRDKDIIFLNRAAIQLLGVGLSALGGPELQALNELCHAGQGEQQQQQPRSVFCGSLRRWLEFRAAPFRELSCDIVFIDDVSSCRTAQQLAALGRTMLRLFRINIDSAVFDEGKFLHAMCNIAVGEDIAHWSFFDIYDQNKCFVRLPSIIYYLTLTHSLIEYCCQCLTEPSTWD